MQSQSSTQPGAFAGRVFIVTGPPCAGKGTQCKRLAQRFGLVHVSTGDVFRYHVEQNTSLGQEAKQYLDNRSFVPDDIVIKFVKERLQQSDVAQQGCLLDGCPRTAGQATALAQAVKVEQVIVLDAPDEALVLRAQKRRVDPLTGDIYHLDHLPPPADVAARVVERDNDSNEAAFRQRIVKYRGNIGGVLPVFQGKAPVQEIDGKQPPEAVFEAIVQKVSAASPKFAPQARTKKAEDDWSDDEVETATASKIQPQLEVTPCADIGEGAAERKVAVSIRVPDEQIRTPVDICCVIDISGSMGQPATAANADEGETPPKDNGLSVLDIVKHSVKAVMGMLKDDDRISIVSFDDKAEVAFALKEMSARDEAVAALDSLRPRGQTNLWDGIRAGMEALREKDSTTSARQKTLLVLTDGQPNIAPPRGHLRELKLYKESHPEFSFQMNTFGFGYDLDSELLAGLASDGNGTYAFIPDAVIVGTTFVNSVANVLSTWTQNAQLHLMPQHGAAFGGPVVGDLQVTEASWGRVVDLGPLQLGQCRDVVVPMQIPEGSAAYIEVVLTYTACGGGQGRATVEGSGRKTSRDAFVAEHRSAAVQVGFNAIRDALANRGKAAQESLDALAGQLASAAACGDERLVALRSDVDGRMSKALKGKERFNRWGKHYLRALARSHQLQLCTNFMDPGLQVYGGSMFKAVRTEGDAAFLSLPAPRPAKDETVLPCDICGQMVAFCDYEEHSRVCGRPGARANAGGAAARRPAPARQRTPSPDMGNYYAGSGGGCFGAKSTVAVVDVNGQEVITSVTDVRRGDRVRVADGTATVKCVVQIVRALEKQLIALADGLQITSQHPVRWNGQWQRPGDLCDDREDHDGFVYNFILDRCHSLLVGGVECVTWAHGLEGPIVKHPYFGTDLVAKGVRALPGWSQGFVRVDGFTRDVAGQVDGVVCTSNAPVACPLAIKTGKYITPCAAGGSFEARALIAQ